MSVDIEELARRIYEVSNCYAEEGVEWEDQHGSARREAIEMAQAALDVLSARRDRMSP